MRPKELKMPKAQDYLIEVRPISEEEGGGYVASIPELGELAFVGDGDTPEEAIKCLEEVASDLFEDYQESGIPIPEPKKVDDFSGHFVQRIPKALHWQLVQEARLNNVSLNQYVTHILSSRHNIPQAEQKLDMILESCNEITRTIGGVHFAIKKSLASYGTIDDFFIKKYMFEPQEPVSLDIEKRAVKSGVGKTIESWVA